MAQLTHSGSERERRGSGCVSRCGRVVGGRLGRGSELERVVEGG